MTRNLARRLAAIEARRRAQRDGLVIPAWIALYRAGATIEARNLAGGSDWVNAAIERQALAEQTLVDYETLDDGCAPYTPRGA